MALAEREINSNGAALVVREGGEMTHGAGRIPAIPAPASYNDLWKLAQQMHASRMFGVTTAEQAMVVLMTGLEIGFGPAQSMRGIHVVKNKPVLSADMMVAICKSRPDICRYFRLVESTDERATWETHRVGEPHPVSITFTEADAVRAGLTSNAETNHNKYPAQMKRARAAAGLARVAYSDLILGLYTKEEVMELPDEQDASARRRQRNVTPAPALQTPDVSPSDALKQKRTEKVAAVVDMLAGLDSLSRTGWLDRFEQKYGLRNIKMLSFEQLDESGSAVLGNKWPYEAEFQAARQAAAEAAPDKPEDYERDPFDGTLIDAPTGAKGHGDS